MENIYVNVGDGYSVLIGRGLLKNTGALCSKAFGRSDGMRIALFTDSGVEELYADIVEKSLNDEGFETFRYVYGAGEQSKNMATVSGFVDFMAENHLTRKDAVVVLGGGVAGDMGGFAASVYLRGIKFIQIPTTLLAAVDSSVGGKTGIDIKAGKNLVGSFWQPSLVICDTDTFDSLEDDLLLDGMAEIIKTSAIRDRGFFERIYEYCISRRYDGAEIVREFLKEDAVSIVLSCVKIKSAVVEQDERESGLRRILNFGHTMGHAVEKYANYEMGHGRAVAMGMCMATRASEASGLTESGTFEKVIKLLSKLGYGTESGYPLSELCEIAYNDKKSAAGKIAFVYLPHIGDAEIVEIPLDRLENFLDI